jgi:hypothetical protein
MKVFVDTWDDKIQPKFLINALYEIKKKENETVNEFNLKFQHVLDKILDEMMLDDLVVLYYYMNAFEPHFGFALKEKEPSFLGDAKQKAIKMESHLIGFRRNTCLVSPKDETKVKTSTHNESTPDPIALLTQKVTKLMKSHTTLMQ